MEESEFKKEVLALLTERLNAVHDFGSYFSEEEWLQLRNEIVNLHYELWIKYKSHEAVLANLFRDMVLPLLFDKIYEKFIKKEKAINKNLVSGMKKYFSDTEQYDKIVELEKLEKENNETDN